MTSKLNSHPAARNDRCSRHEFGIDVESTSTSARDHAIAREQSGDPHFEFAAWLEVLDGDAEGRQNPTDATINRGRRTRSS
jgi:hypothetical protein